MRLEEKVLSLLDYRPPLSCTLNDFLTLCMDYKIPHLKLYIASPDWIRSPGWSGLNVEGSDYYGLIHDKFLANVDHRSKIPPLLRFPSRKFTAILQPVTITSMLSSDLIKHIRILDSLGQIFLVESLVVEYSWELDDVDNIILYLNTPSSSWTHRTSLQR